MPVQAGLQPASPMPVAPQAEGPAGAQIGALAALGDSLLKERQGLKGAFNIPPPEDAVQTQGMAPPPDAGTALAGPQGPDMAPPPQGPPPPLEALAGSVDTAQAPGAKQYGQDPIILGTPKVTGYDAEGYANDVRAPELRMESYEQTPQKPAFTTKKKLKAFGRS
jgi:hypothetical protein